MTTRKSEFEKGITKVLDKEGGYIDHPLDRGGPTNKGITLETFRNYRKNPSLTAGALKNLSKKDASEIYYKEYVLYSGLYLLEEHCNYNILLHFLLDTCVHHGKKYVVEALQGNLGVKVDGVIGPKTTEAFREENHHHLLLDMMKDRINWFFTIVFNDPTQEVFLKGWINRVSSFVNPPSS